MATIIFSTTFNLQATTKVFNFTDTTDYAGQGLTASDMYGCFKISIGGSVVYDSGTPSTINYDIKNAVSPNSVGTIQIPIDNLLPENGLYTIVYTVFDNGNTTTYTVTETFNFIYASPAVEVSGSVQVYTPSPLLTLYDNTVYIVNSVVPTIDRTATITYPPILVNNIQSTPTPTVGTTATTTSTTFYSPTTVEMEVITNLTYTYSNFTVLDTVSGSVEGGFRIDATSFCKLYCGLKTFQARCVANPQDEDLREQFAYMMGIVTLIMLAQNCGKTEYISSLISQLEGTGNFTEDCQCGSGVQQVIGLGSIVSAYDVVGANSWITVTPTTSGNTTTFTIQLSPAFVSVVQAMGTEITNIDNAIVVINATLGTLQSEINISLLQDTSVTSSNSSVGVSLVAVCIGSKFISSGTGFTAGDILTASGGTFISPATIVVDSVDGSNRVLTWHISSGGVYTVLPANNVSFTGGTGAVFSLYWDKVYDLSVNLPTLSDYGLLGSPVVLLADNTSYPLFTTGVVIPSNGTYKLEFEAAVNNQSSATITGTHYFTDNAVDTAIGLGGSNEKRGLSLITGSTDTLSICHATIATLVSGHTVNVNFHITAASDGATQVEGRTLIVTKIG